MNSWRLVVLLVAVCLLFTACGGETTENEQAGEGKEIVLADDPAYKDVYQKSTCVMCHGADLQGGAGPSLIGIGNKHDQAGLMNIIKNGIGSMGAQYDANISSGLTDENLNDLASWLSKQK